MIQSPVYSCYKIQPSFAIWVPSALWGKGKWSDLSVFDKNCNVECFKREMLNQVLCLVKKMDPSKKKRKKWIHDGM